MTDDPAPTPTAHLQAASALERANAAGSPRFATLFEHGTLVVEFYAPRGSDPQTPHTRDELYVVAQGSGTFYDGTTRRPFAPGDLIFVAAGVPHRFENFTDDLGVWVMFYGPEGGEAGTRA